MLPLITETGEGFKVQKRQEEIHPTSPTCHRNKPPECCAAVLMTVLEMGALTILSKKRKRKMKAGW